MAPADLHSPPCSQGVPVTETRDDHVTWLTQEAYDRLKAELDHLSGPGRVEIAKKIEARPRRGRPARERRVSRGQGGAGQAGGPHQPDPAHPAERQGRRAAADRRRGRPGMTVTVRFDGDDDEVTFLLASREESGSPIDVYSPRSPLGSAIVEQEGRREPRPTPCRTAAPPRSRFSRRSPTGSLNPAGPNQPDAPPGQLSGPARLLRCRPAAPHQPTSSGGSAAGCSAGVARPRSGTSLRKQARMNTAAAS